MRPAPGVAPRVVAVRVLDAVLRRGQSLKSALAHALPTLDDVRDRALAEAIVFAALREYPRYAAALRLWMDNPPSPRESVLRALLYTGLAQLDALRLPAHAAVAATVDAARAVGRAHQAGLVNALLRRALRDALPNADPADAWPDWLRARLVADWPEQASAIFAASAQPAPMWLRVNRRRETRDGCLQRLQAAGIAADGSDVAPDAICLHERLAVAQLPGFDTGHVSVQDAAAQLVCDALGPAHGARVLDACAAPGGKAAHLAERDASLRITSLDLDPRRVRRMQEAFARLGLDIDARAADATQPATWWDGEPFDAILLDAPCSATGIVRRQPDILLHRRERDLAALCDTQARLLDATWPLLVSGGTLVYATCSLLRDENERQIDAFLALTPDAQAEPLDARFGHASGAGRQRFPGEDSMDGFFYARLRKR